MTCSREDGVFLRKGQSLNCNVCCLYLAEYGRQVDLQTLGPLPPHLSKCSLSPSPIHSTFPQYLTGVQTRKVLCEHIYIFIELSKRPKSGGNY